MARKEIAVHRQKLRHRSNVCDDVFFNSDFTKMVGLGDIKEMMKSKWLQETESALAKNTSTFAILPIHHILGSESFLKALEAKGYRVIAPGGD